MKRRTLLKSALAAGFLISSPSTPILGANDAIRIGVIGIGSFIKIGGKGRGDIRDFRTIPGVRVDAICDCDTQHMNYELQKFKDRGEKVKTYVDFRDLINDENLDAVSITTPNHWHSLMTIMACQAGKDVFVQKPSSHNLFEGRQMVEAMRKYKRIVQATHGPRNSGATAEAYKYIHEGNLGEIQYIYGINYKPRMSIGNVTKPQPVPETCNYDLWCGPAPKKPLMRKHLHYDWHWVWDTGDGDLGNMGIHAMDGCRWALGENQLPKQVISIGGRLGYEDDGETPNTLITMLAYESAPIIFEVRGLPKNASYLEQNWTNNPNKTMDQYHGIRIGTIVICEDGYVQENAAYDHDGNEIQKFDGERKTTKENFIEAVRNQNPKLLYTDALEGHLSCGLVHMANISWRTGQEQLTDVIRERIQGEKQLNDSFERLMSHLSANKINLKKEPLVLGSLLTMNQKTERFEGEFSEEANRYLSRDYREPFAVPKKV